MQDMSSTIVRRLDRMVRGEDKSSSTPSSDSPPEDFNRTATGSCRVVQGFQQNGQTDGKATLFSKWSESDWAQRQCGLLGAFTLKQITFLTKGKVVRVSALHLRRRRFEKPTLLGRGLDKGQVAVCNCILDREHHLRRRRGNPVVNGKEGKWLIKRGKGERRRQKGGGTSAARLHTTRQRFPCNAPGW